MTSEPLAGHIYLLHFQDRKGRVEHYVGWTRALEPRLYRHFCGSGGCPTTARYRKQGMRGALVRLWEGTVWGERLLQQTLEFPQDCPVCCGAPLGDISCEGWVTTDTPPTGPLKPWNHGMREMEKDIGE